MAVSIFPVPSATQDPEAPPGALQKIADATVEGNLTVTVPAAGRYAVKYMGSVPYAGVHNLRQEKRTSLLQNNCWTTFTVTNANEKINIGAIFEKDVSQSSNQPTTGFAGTTLFSMPTSIPFNPTVATYSSVHNLYIIGGTAGEIYTSSDGFSWTARTSTFVAGDFIRNFVESPSGTIVSFTQTGKIAYSTNGTSWTASSIPSPGMTPFSGVWGNNRFVIVGQSGRNINSTDGITWTNGTTAPNSYIMSDVAYNAGTWVAPIGTGVNPPSVYYSIDGSNWTQTPTAESGTTGTFGQIGVFNNQFVIRFDNRIMTSYNGIQWNNKVNASNDITRRSIYCGWGQIVGNDTSSNRVYASNPETDVALYRVDTQFVSYGSESGYHVFGFGPARMITATNTTQINGINRRPLTGRVLVYRVD